MMAKVSNSQQRIEELALASPSLIARVLVITMLAMVSCFVLWAAIFEIDIRVKGSGKVIPTSKLQQIQHLEGGVVTDILIAEGDIVQPGQILLKLSPKKAEQRFVEARATSDGLVASIARLQAELLGTAPDYSQAIKANTPPSIIRAEEQLRSERAAMLQAQLNIVDQQKNQRLTEINGYEKRLPFLKKSLSILQKEIRIKRQLIRDKVAAPAELLSLEREHTGMQEKMLEAAQQAAVSQQMLAELDARKQELITTFRSDARGQLNDRMVRLASLKGDVDAGEDAVVRTEVVAPVRGIIKTLLATTIGGVVRAGDTIIELVPLDQTLLVEARVSPADIANLDKGLSANVRLSAFDSMISGGIKGQLERISPDSQSDEKTGRTFYRVYVRTLSATVQGPTRVHQIVPGMEADVDILTGKRTVLDYLLKPIIRGMSRALSEK
ncbi:HlyD family type I secretion periplasmic adaptor subunit [Pelagibaculum spongiae]|uniref:Membrane fusion protein (MFP) family protein n=1 Tax=Pelagibaculum spongiae TaxID=2080658 RepID=A0A2V1GV23_9GAMM|nr:HlyD family type I secretion periplasmic adaptor subunit [Pelagibaculum spongiae]PVZ68793.1 HlyD family type I secretion periplasmic adaptor subunit [Pelagibaculum spongiae]